MFPNHPGKVGIGGTHHTDIHLSRTTVSQDLKGLLLQHPKQFDLATQIQISYLIQENSSLVRQFKTPHTVGSSIRKRSFFMTEHFTLEQSM